MMLTQCNVFALFPPRLRALLAQLTVSCDAPLALLVDHVAFALKLCQHLLSLVPLKIHDS